MWEQLRQKLTEKFWEEFLAKMWGKWYRKNVHRENDTRSGDEGAAETCRLTNPQNIIAQLLLEKKLARG